MYRNSAFSKSLSSFFHPAKQLTLNNENKSDSDIPLIDTNGLPPLEKESINGSGHLKKKLSFLRSSSAKETPEKPKEEKNSEYLQELYENFGGDQDDRIARLYQLNTNSRPSTAQQMFRSPESSVPGSSDMSMEFPTGTKLSNIPDLSLNSKPPSPIRFRERLSKLLGKSRSASPELERPVRNTELPPPISRELTDKDQIQPPRVVKNKSSLKIIEAVATQEDYKKQILECNPKFAGFTFYPSKARTKNQKKTELLFQWTLWAHDGDNVLGLSEIETITDANNFVDFSKNQLSAKWSVDIMRKGLIPRAGNRNFDKAGTLYINIPFQGSKRFTIWNFMLHLILSDYLYNTENLHEPIVGISWIGTPETAYMKLWFCRNHDSTSSDLYELSRICHFIKSILSDNVEQIMNQENLMYCVSDTETTYINAIY